MSWRFWNSPRLRAIGTVAPQPYVDDAQQPSIPADEVILEQPAGVSPETLLERELAPFIDAQFYRDSNPDVSFADESPLQHYLRSGEIEGRAPNPDFDPTWYLAQYSEVAASGMSALVHYVRYGRLDGRPTRSADETVARSNPVPEATRDPLHEELAPYFDEPWYLSYYPEIPAHGMSALGHYIERGEREGRWPSQLFDPRWYLGQYTEVAASGMPPLLHYVRYGRLDGRPTRSGDERSPAGAIAHDSGDLSTNHESDIERPEQSVPSDPVDAVEIFAQLGYPRSH